MKRLLILVALVLSVALTQWAQSPRELFAKNLKVSASNSYAYPSADLPKLTPAPKGYKPFYIDHYGRHGSRWLVSTKQYSIPVEQLAIAERNGKLTERGKELLSVLREMKDDSNNRLGDLTDLGAEQHRGIAQRMYRNFPAVFADSASIDARATVVIRCVLSMENELQELRMLNPKLKIFHDASQADMHYMNYNDTVVRNKRKFVDNTVAKFGENKVNPDYMLGKLFTDMKFAHVSERAYHYLTQANYMMLEANYDSDMLTRGRYPEYLKNRIRAANGHLDNADAARFLADNYTEDLKYVFLCHLSNDNNTPEIALEAVRNELLKKNVSVGTACNTLEDQGKKLQLMALPRYDASPWFVLHLLT